MIDARTFEEARPCHCDGFHIENRTQIAITHLEEDSIVPEDMLLIFHTSVPGYTFSERRWALFKVDKIEEIEFADAFRTALMLPQKQKDPVLSLVQSSNADDASGVGDFVHGKGKGVVLLLHGVPGVGKTLTAGTSVPFWNDFGSSSDDCYNDDDG